MELMEDKSKSIPWFGAQRGWGPRLGFSKMAQQRDGVSMTSGASAVPSSWVGKQVKSIKEGILGETEDRGHGVLSKAEEVVLGQ